MKTPTPLRIALLATTACALAFDFPILRAQGDSIIEVADSNTAVPGLGGTFGGFFAPAVSDGTAVFTGDRNNIAFGIYTGSGGGLTRIADLSTAIPGGQGNFTSLDFTPSISNGTVAFTGYGPQLLAVGEYKGSGRECNRYRRQEYLRIPGLGGNFTVFGPTASSDQAIAFTGGRTAAAVSGVYESTGGVPTKVIDTNTNYPGIGFFTGLERASISGTAFGGFQGRLSFMQNTHVGIFYGQRRRLPGHTPRRPEHPYPGRHRIVHGTRRPEHLGLDRGVYRFGDELAGWGLLGDEWASHQDRRSQHGHPGRIG